MKWIRNKFLSIVGVTLGAILGYFYYKFEGCHSGTCSITSSPVYSTVYGSLLGFFIAGIFEPSKSKTP